VKRVLPFAIALLLDALGAGGALLIATRDWQTITTPRPRPLSADVLEVSGRTVDTAPTALALVALAGVVAVLATRGAVRRAVGAIVALAGLGLIWRAAAAASAVGISRARSLVTAHHATVDASAVVPQVTTHPLWPALTIVCAAAITVAGALIAWRGHRWQVMSTRYEPPASRQAPAGESAATLWTALDRGDDPTG